MLEQPWRSMFPTLAAARRYLTTIRDPQAREQTAQDLGIPPVSEKGKSIYNQTAAPPLPTEPHPIPAPAFAPAAFSLSLPFPPSVNAVWRSVVVRCTPKQRGGPPYRAKVLLSARGRQYRKAVLLAVREQGSPSFSGTPRLAVRIDIWPPDKRRRDVSNIPKAVEDALTHAGLWHDDSQIDELHLYRREWVKGGRLELSVQVLGVDEVPVVAQARGEE